MNRIVYLFLFARGLDPNILRQSPPLITLVLGKKKSKSHSACHTYSSSWLGICLETFGFFVSFLTRFSTQTQSRPHSSHPPFFFSPPRAKCYIPLISGGGRDEEKKKKRATRAPTYLQQKWSRGLRLVFSLMWVRPGSGGRGRLVECVGG